MGSGNGLPGVILSIMGLKMTLSENDKKKVSFLRYVRSELELTFDVYEDDIYKMTQPFQQTTARAFTSLNRLIRVQKNVSRETSVASGVYLKGDKIEEELNEAVKHHSFEYEIKNLEQGCVVKINLKGVR
jgi:16S rRNA G527 N7-methylase RsmG